jgi:hypothetical protein
MGDGYSDVRSPTSTRTEVRSPTSTATHAYTSDNITVTGGAGAGNTTVHIHPRDAIHGCIGRGNFNVDLPRRIGADYNPDEMVGMDLTANASVPLYKAPGGDVLYTIVPGGYAGNIQSWTKDAAGNVWFAVAMNQDDPSSQSVGDQGFVMQTPDAFDKNAIEEQATDTSGGGSNDAAQKLYKQQQAAKDNTSFWDGVPTWVPWTLGGMVAASIIGGVASAISGRR